MDFLLPAGLFGLLSLPIIILLHLRRERPRRRRVPSTLLWARLASVQRQPEPKRLPLTLLLLIHLLVAALLALALARPVLPGIDPGRNRNTILLLDTSTSMAAAAGAGGSRFAAALQRIEQYAADLGPEDTLTVISLSPEARIVARIEGQPLGERAWQALAPAGVTLDLNGGLNLANGLLDPERANRVVILTDATWLPETLPLYVEPVGAPVQWETFGGRAGNQAIVAFAARPIPTGGVDLVARVVNFDDAPVARTLRLVALNPDGTTGAVLGDHPLALPANREIVQHWVLDEAQAEAVQVELSGGDSQPLDDRAVLSLVRTQALPVRVVGPRSESLERVLEALPNFVLDPDLPPEAAALSVYHGEAPSSWPNTPVLLVNPPALSEESASPGTLSRQDDPLVRGLDLSGVAFRGFSAPMPEWAEPVLVDERNPSRVLIWRGMRGPVRVLALNFDLEQTNLPVKLAFPLLMSRIAAELTPAAIPPAVLLGEPVVFPWDAGQFRVLGVDGRELRVEAEGDAATVRPQSPGLYTVELAGSPVARFAVHAGAPLESELRPFQGERLPAVTEVPLQQEARDDPPLRELWPLLVAGALVLLLLEQLYERVRLRPGPARGWG